MANESALLDPFLGFSFKVTVVDLQDPSVTANFAFSKVSGLNEETEVAEYRTGMDPLVKRKIAGLNTYGNVTLERGIDRASLLHAWRDLVAKGDFLTGTLSYKKTVMVSLLQSRVQGAEPLGLAAAVATRVWTLRNAWPTVYNVGDLDANSSDVLVESIELAHEGIIKYTITDPFTE